MKWEIKLICKIISKKTIKLLCLVNKHHSITIKISNFLENLDKWIPMEEQKPSDNQDTPRED